MRECTDLYALILAAGLGTRLAPITLVKPKPLLNVLGSPLIERALREILKLKPKRIFVNVHYKRRQMIDAIRRLERELGIDVNVLEEEELLDTGGTIKRVYNLLFQELRGDACLLVHNVDVIVPFPLRELITHHLRSGSTVTLLCVKPSPIFSFTSNLKLNVKLKVRGEPLSEVAEVPSERGDVSFCGVYVIDLRRIGSVLPQRDVFSAVELFREASALHFKGTFWDMGTFPNLLRFLSDLQLRTWIPLSFTLTY